VERGADRLALIAGRIQTLPPSHDENTANAASDPSSQPLLSNDQDLQPQVSNQTTVSPQGEDKAPGSLLLERDPISNASQTNVYDGGSDLPPSLNKSETCIEALITPATPAAEVNGKVQPTLVSSIDQNSSDSTFASEQHLQQQIQQHRFFTPKQISSAIAASENIRLLSSVTVALIVVLSYLGFPLLGTYIIKSIISFRPLYLLLLTNVTVVLAQLLFGKQRGFQRAARDENENTQPNGYGWAEQVSRTLETGLVMQKAFDAVFMDCSVYAITVICGLSLAQLFS